MPVTTLRAVVPLVLAALVAASCTDDRSGGPGQESPERGLSGTVLALADPFRGGVRGLMVIELPGGEERPLGLLRGNAPVAGFFHEDGSVIAALSPASGPLRTQIYRATTVGGEAPLGLPLEGGPYRFSFAGDTVLAADCARDSAAYLLDLRSRQAWRRVAGACLATLSPDGQAMVYARSDRSLFRAPVDGAEPPEPILDLRDLESLPAGLEGEVSILGLRWGEQGLALAVGSADRLAVVVVGSEGEPRVMGLGDRGPAADIVMAWQPGGGLLAVASGSSLEGIVRILDPRTGDGRVLALLRLPPDSLVFSPDGEVVLSASQTNWTYVGTDGTWIRSVTKQWGEARPLAWRA